jgi:hypothetical protein
MPRSGAAVDALIWVRPRDHLPPTAQGPIDLGRMLALRVVVVESSAG